MNVRHLLKKCFPGHASWLEPQHQCSPHFVLSPFKSPPSAQTLFSNSSVSLYNLFSAHCHVVKSLLLFCNGSSDNEDNFSFFSCEFCAVKIHAFAEVLMKSDSPAAPRVAFKRLVLYLTATTFDHLIREEWQFPPKCHGLYGYYSQRAREVIEC